MATSHHRYIVDEQGNRVAVVIDIAAYTNLLEELEGLEAIRAYDAAKASEDKPIPFEQSVEKIERERR